MHDGIAALDCLAECIGLCATLRVSEAAQQGYKVTACLLDVVDDDELDVALYALALEHALEVLAFVCTAYGASDAEAALQELHEDVCRGGGG